MKKSTLRQMIKEEIQRLNESNAIVNKYMKWAEKKYKSKFGNDLFASGMYNSTTRVITLHLFDDGIEHQKELVKGFQTQFPKKQIKYIKSKQCIQIS